MLSGRTKAIGLIFLKELKDTSYITKDIFHPNQLSGVRQRSTEDAGLFLTHLVRAGWTTGLKTSVLAFDVAQFFPSLNHELCS